MAQKEAVGFVFSMFVGLECYIWVSVLWHQTCTVSIILESRNHYENSVFL